MDFYLTDRKYNLLGIASTSNGGSFLIGNDTDYELVPQSVGRTYSGTLYFTPDQAAAAEQAMATGNYLLYLDEQHRYVFMTVMEASFDALNGTIDFTAENGGLDLINTTVGAYTAAKAMPIADYISMFTADSGFEIGTNELAGQSRTLTWESDEETALKRVESVANQFDAELDFRFEITGTQVVKRYIDIYHHIGADKAQRLEVNTHVNKIVTNSNIYDLCTAIQASGNTAEGSDVPITLKGYSWTDPDGRYVLGSDGVLRDTVAVQQWSRLLSNSNQHPNSAHIMRVKTYTANSQAELLRSAIADLKKYNHAEVNYEVDLAELPASVLVGDMVHLVDEAQGLNLSARLLELKTSYANQTREATFGDYLIETSQLDPALQELADQMKNLSATRQWYPWIRYADDDTGNGISALPAGKAYMAVVWNDQSAVPSDDPADYSGHWQKVKGDDGVGAQGPKGDDGKTSYFHTAYADDVNGSGFSQSPTGKAYIGTYVDFTEADSANASDYTWVLIKGEDGKNGSDGKDGAQGPAGPAGKDITSYDSGVTLPTTVAPKNSQFWVVDLNGYATAFYKSDGSKWVKQEISAAAIAAATFNGLTFNGVTFNGSEFISSFKNAPVDESDFAGITDPTGQIMLNKGTGTTNMGDGYLTVDGTIDGSSGTGLQTFHTEVGPAGYLSRLYTGGTAESNITAGSQLYLGQLSLKNLDTTGKLRSGWINGEMLEHLDNVGRVLWSGVLLMTAAHTVTPTVPLSKTHTGWRLVWSRYTNNAPQDAGFCYKEIDKTAASLHSGKSFVFTLSTAFNTTSNFDAASTKLIYVTDTKVTGYDANTKGDAGGWVLREVVAI